MCKILEPFLKWLAVMLIKIIKKHFSVIKIHLSEAKMPIYIILLNIRRKLVWRKGLTEESVFTFYSTFWQSHFENSHEIISLHLHRRHLVTPRWMDSYHITTKENYMLYISCAIIWIWKIMEMMGGWAHKASMWLMTRSFYRRRAVRASQAKFRSHPAKSTESRVIPNCT